MPHLDSWQYLCTARMHTLVGEGRVDAGRPSSAKSKTKVSTLGASRVPRAWVQGNGVTDAGARHNAASEAVGARTSGPVDTGGARNSGAADTGSGAADTNGGAADTDGARTGRAAETSALSNGAAESGGARSNGASEAGTRNNEAVETCGAQSNGVSEPFARSKPPGPDASTMSGPAEIVSNPLIEDLIAPHTRRGVLIPLKTTQELHQDHTIVQALITRVPVKSTSDVLNILREMLPEDNVKNLPHLRRCAKPSDLPTHIKTRLMNDTAFGRQVHTGRSSWNYVLLGDSEELDAAELAESLSKIEGMSEGGAVFMTKVPVPLVPPTSQIQAALWTGQFWPCVYRKNNPLGPHPSVVGRATDDIRDDASVWMALAHRAAHEARDSGVGEAIGAVIVQREGSKVELVAVAGDARWYQENLPGLGNPMAHCVLRAVSLVAHKLTRQERRAGGQQPLPGSLVYDALQDHPITKVEKEAFDMEHPNQDGYLCHGLELYLTHEPCVQCSMSILHSRMGKVIFSERMPLTGGMCSEIRGHGYPEFHGGQYGPGLGLFWRRELNWSLLAWEWESGGSLEPLPQLAPQVHA